MYADMMTSLLLEFTPIDTQNAYYDKDFPVSMRKARPWSGRSSSRLRRSRILARTRGFPARHRWFWNPRKRYGAVAKGLEVKREKQQSVNVNLYFLTDYTAIIVLKDKDITSVLSMSAMYIARVYHTGRH